MATTSQSTRTRSALFARPGTCFVDERPILAYGLVPDAIMVFQEASRRPRPVLTEESIAFEAKNAATPFECSDADGAGDIPQGVLLTAPLFASTPVRDSPSKPRVVEARFTDVDIQFVPYASPVARRSWVRRVPQRHVVAACLSVAVLSASSIVADWDALPREPTAEAVEPERVEVSTGAGEVVDIESGFGVVELTVPGDADVWIDGGARGVVQGTGLFTLPVGDHFVDVRTDGQIESRDIDVADGASVELRFPLQE